MKYQYSDTNKRYYTYDYFLKKTFGGKTIKIPLDGGFTCPNIDGTRGRGGCTYCSKECLPYRGRPLAEQFEEARRPLMKKWWRDGMTERYIPYFQVFSGTYADVEKLRALYYGALSLPNTVGLSVATRADCLNGEVVSLLREISEKTFLTVELGLQTVHEETAEQINRCHTYREFLDGYEKLEGINRCIHIINGLPGEDRDMMIETAREIALLRPHAVKIHMLYLEKGTEMARQYQEKPFPILTLDEYVSTVVEQLEYLPPDTVIGRLTGDGRKDRLIAPLWTEKKFCVLNEIDKLFASSDSCQGAKYGN